MYIYIYITFTSTGPHESSDSEDEIALGALQNRIIKKRQNAVREAINGRLQSARNEDGFAQLLASVTLIKSTVQHISAAVSTMQSSLTQLQEDVTLLKRDRDLLKRIINNTSPATPGSTTSATAPTAARPAGNQPDAPETPRTARPAAITTGSPYTARYISAPTPGKMFLGGTEGMERDITWYKDILKMVSWKKKDTDQERGRLLCMKLLRVEFSRDDLSTKNVTGFTRADNHKIIEMPMLDQGVLFAIFNQAKYQWPQFTDWYNMRSCATVKDLNDICKKVRKEHIVVQQERIALPVQQDDINVNAANHADEADIAEDN